jgi:DNA polymerase-3 subunit delta
MAILKGPAADQFIRRPPADAAAILIYGADSGAIRERAVALVKAVAGQIDDPFNVVRLEESSLATDPARLADEYDALSLMGERRAIWIADADRAFLKAVEPLLERPAGSNLIVAEAGNLAKSSPLRVLFERAKSAYALACYQDSEQDLHDLVRSELHAMGVDIESEAERLLISLLSSDRILSRSEITKLALYAMGGPAITVADVEAVCGDASILSIDDVIDAVFEGDLIKCDEGLSRLVTSGVQLGTVMSLVAMHAARLQQLRLEVDRGRSVNEVVRSARPPIFFKKVNAMTRQLQVWDSDSLATASSSIAVAVLQTRELPPLDEAITSRALLSLARNARLLRSERF